MCCVHCNVCLPVLSNESSDDRWERELRHGPGNRPVLFRKWEEGGGIPEGFFLYVIATVCVPRKYPCIMVFRTPAV
jgi:hypothetical protein